MTLLTTVNQLEFAAIGAVGLAGLGVAGYLVWKWGNKEPNEILDDIAGTGEKIIGDPLAGAIKTTTGGAVNFKTKTFGTLGSAQDEYEADMKMKKTPGLKFLATIGSASPLTATVTGVGQLIKQGKDKKLAKELKAKGDTEQLSTKLQDTHDAVKSKDPKKVEKIKVATLAEVERLIKPEQKAEIAKQVDKFKSAHKYIYPKKWTTPQKNRLRKLLIAQKQIKYLVNRGIFVKEVWRQAAFLNQRQITRGFTKILFPHAPVILTKQNQKRVRDFINSI